MNNIQETLHRKIALEAAENALLLKMLTVDWEAIPIDTVIVCDRSLQNIIHKPDIRHYAGIKGQGPSVFCDGRTSVTSSSTATTTYCFMIPKDLL